MMLYEYHSPIAIHKKIPAFLLLKLFKYYRHTDTYCNSKTFWRGPEAGGFGKLPPPPPPVDETMLALLSCTHCLINHAHARSGLIDLGCSLIWYGMIWSICEIPRLSLRGGSYVMPHLLGQAELVLPLFGGRGKKGSGDSSLNDLCHSKIVVHQSDCSILVN